MKGKRGFRTLVVGSVAALVVLALPGSSWAGGPGHWTKLATVDQSFSTLSLLRTHDDNLHVAWLAKRASNLTQSFRISTISDFGKLLSTSTPLSGWNSLQPDVQLVHDGSGLRLIFEGGTGSSGCYDSGAVFTMTSSDGNHWALGTGSVSHGTVGNGNLAATTKLDGVTPVAVFAAGHAYHVGVDSSCPAAGSDGVVAMTPGSAPENPQVVTDQASGATWDGWYQSFEKQGYWVDQILPTHGAPIEAPHGGATPTQNNQPNEPVALAARPGGGVYMAYCVATNSEPCAHIDLWKVHTSKVEVVPGSRNVGGARVTLSAGPQGRMWVVWYDTTKQRIHAVRSNIGVTSFGPVRTIKPPAHTSGFEVVRAEGSSARLDIVILDQLGTTGLPLDIFHTQVLPGLSVSAKPTKFSHKKPGKVTFTVKDAGQAVAGAGVACLKKKASTNSAGKVTLKFRKRSPKGKHVCTASKK